MFPFLYIRFKPTLKPHRRIRTLSNLPLPRDYNMNTTRKHNNQSKTHTHTHIPPKKKQQQQQQKTTTKNHKTHKKEQKTNKNYKQEQKKHNRIKTITATKEKKIQKKKKTRFYFYTSHLTTNSFWFSNSFCLPEQIPAIISAQHIILCLPRVSWGEIKHSLEFRVLRHTESISQSNELYDFEDR